MKNIAEILCCICEKLDIIIKSLKTDCDCDCDNKGNGNNEG